MGIRYGKVVRPSMGITIVNDRFVNSIEKQLRRKLDGVLVAEVLPNSPAVVAGLEASQLRSDGSIVLGDLITHVNGVKVAQTEDLLSVIEAKKDGDVVNLSISRKADPRRKETVSVKLTTRDKLESDSGGTRKIDTKKNVTNENRYSMKGPLRNTVDAWQ